LDSADADTITIGLLPHEGLKSFGEHAHRKTPIEFEARSASQRWLNLLEIPSNLVPLFKRLAVRVVRSANNSLE
jgi:hypothetical protein